MILIDLKMLSSDTTPPAPGTVTPSNIQYNNTFVDSPFDLSTSFTDNESDVTSCEYTINNGTNWYAAVVSGSKPNFTCTKIGITGTNGQSLTLNMRATSAGDTGTAVAITRTVDASAPITTNNSSSTWTNASPVTVTLNPTDGSGSGVASTKYCVDISNTCTPATTGTSASVTCASGSECTQYVRYFSTDNVGNQETTKSSNQIKQDRKAPVDGTTFTATSGDGPCSLAWSPATDSGSGLNTTDAYKLVYLTGATPPNANCTNGIDITAVTTGIIYNHTGLANGTQYSYRVCAYDAVNNISAGITKTCTPQASNVTISGYVKTSDGSAISGVTMSGDSCTSTDGNGYYSCTVSYGWNGTITPSNSGYMFTPPTRSYNNATANQTNQDYTGTVITALYIEPLGFCGGNTPCYTKIQDGIDAAGAGTVIKVAQGTYHENIYIQDGKDIILEGGWNSNFTTRSTDPALTVIDGDTTGDGIGDNTVIRILAENGEHIECTIEGFTIRNGNGSGGGIFASATSSSVVILRINRNIIADNFSQNFGGGIYLYNDSGGLGVELINNIITDNIASNYGGGISTRTTGNGITANEIYNNTVSGNTGSDGGGLDSYAWNGGYAQIELVNNIIWGNTASVGSDILLAAFYPEDVVINSSYNSIGSIYNVPADPGTYNDLGENIINENPLFQNSASGDYHLTPGSPCIDAGTNEDAPSTDSEGDTRPFDGDGDAVAIVDIGADEYVGQIQFALTVSKLGTGTGTVTSNPSGISCGSDCSESYNPGTVVTLTAIPATGSTFASWTGCTPAPSDPKKCTATVSDNTTVTATFQMDTNPPTGSIIINGGADYTNNKSVLLTLTATDDGGGPFRMCVSNTISCTRWTAFAATKSWRLSSDNGIKTVYVWFKDQCGNINSTPYSDTIILDSVKPVNGIVTGTPGDTQVTLNWSGFSDLSEIVSYKVVYNTRRAPSSCSRGTVIYAGPDTSYPHAGLINGTTYGYRICAIDKAGNISTGATVSAMPASP